MSNFQAISAVNAALKRVVQSAANSAVNNTTVRLGPPNAKLAEDNKPLVNIHLYKIEPNPGQVNAHLPSRSGSGQVVSRAKLAMNLHYVFSFYGDSEKFVPDLLLGSVSLSMEQIPVLSQSAISKAIIDNDALADSDLANSVEKIRFTRELVSLDDFSKIWSIFYQVPHTISLLYVGSHIVLESQEPVAPSLPVTSRAFHVSPLSSIHIEFIGNDSETGGPAYWNQNLFVMGEGLGKAGSKITLDEHEIDLGFQHVIEGGLVVSLSSGLLGGKEWAIGPHVARITGPGKNQNQPTHLRPKSNAVAFALHPDISLPADAVSITNPGALQSGKIKVDFIPAVQQGQLVELILDSRDDANPGRFNLQPDELLDTEFPASQIVFTFNDLSQGDYLLRAIVDGFPSRVILNTDPDNPEFGQIKGPQVTLS